MKWQPAVRARGEALAAEEAPCQDPERVGVAARALVAVVRGYQSFGSPLVRMLGAECRFHPTCSEYAAQAIAKHGPLAGVWKAARRLLCCHPFHPGGLDPP